VYLTVYPSQGTGISMSDTIAESAVTDEQRAEWNALHDRMRELAEATHEAEREAGSTLRWSLSNPDGEEWAMKDALESAKRAADLWAERVALSAQTEAHPYTAVVRARIAERKAAEATS